MPVFISYSHQDKTFVDRLAAQLVRQKVNVWLDRWELKIGDSLISKVQDAIVGASALLVILSKNSVASEWCKKELNSGLMRELTERRVVVLPIVLDDCDIPLFLREKMYADFRTDFDDGLRAVLEAVAVVNTEAQGREDSPEWHTDWSIDWGEHSSSGRFVMTLTMVEAAQAQPYSVLALIDFIANKEATKYHKKMAKKDMGREARRAVISSFIEFIGDDDKLTFRLKDNFAQRREAVFIGDDPDHIYAAKIECRWMGQDTGRDVLYRLGDAIRQIFKHMEEVAFRPQSD